jgi:CubicO group peptidase (beta-lactamase class C family)
LENVLQEKLFTPLGMNDTKIKLSEVDQERLATGYNIMDKEAKYWDTEVFRGAIGAKSTLNDLLIFIKAQLQSSDQVLIQTLQNMQLTATQTPIKKVKSGLGWHHVQPKKRYYHFLAHSGATDGHQVYVCFLKETKTATIVMANSKHNIGGLGSYLLEMLNNKWKRRK